MARIVPSRSDHSFATLGRLHRTVVAAFVSAASIAGPCANALAFDLSVDDSQPAVPTPGQRYLATALEELGALGIQAAWYWGHMKHTSPDDVSFSWQTWREKLFSDDYIVFDDDRFRTGGLGHPFAGALYYQIARGNGFGVAGSFAWTFASSTVWQYVGEWNTKPSTNDLLITPAAGWLIGEATFRLGRFFAEGQPTVGNCIGAVLFAPFAAVNEGRVCHEHERVNGPPFDRWGFGGRTWHHLDLELGAAHTSFDQGDARDEAVAGLGARIVANSRYRRAGYGASTAGPGQWSTLSFRAFMNDGAVTGAFLQMDTLVVGRYYRNYGDIDATGRGLDGQGALVGLGGLYDYDERKLPFARDRIATIGILGPVAELETRRGLAAIRARLAVAYAFGQVTSLAYARTQAAFADVIIKSELKDHGYYYAQGIVSDGLIELELGDFRLAVAGRAGTFWSFDSDDTNQSRIQDNFPLRDTRLFLRAVASLQPRGGPLRFAIEFDDDVRESWIPTATLSFVEKRLLGSALLVF
jgi:hypothetical protein